MGNHGLSVLYWICQQVDAVDEDHEPVLLQAMQQAQQAHIAGRKRLLRVQDEDASIGALQCFARERVAHQERIVGSRGVYDRRGVGERRQVEIKIGRFCYVGKATARRLQTVDRLIVNIADTDIALQHLGGCRREAMLLTEQLPELLTETALGALAHEPDLSHQRVRVERQSEALAEFLQAPAGRQALPIGLIEELVDRPGIGRLAEMQIRDHRGPGIYIRRQEAGTLNQGVD